jgi:hypothetical protein
MQWRKNMTYPLEQMGLAQERHLELLREAEMIRQIPKRIEQPSLIRQWTGSGLIWIGGRLVNWGSGIAPVHHAQRVEMAG